MSLDAIYTSNYMFFRDASLDNVIKFHIHIKLHDCLGACHGKILLNAIYTSNYMFFFFCFLFLKQHQITRLFRGVLLRNVIYTSNYMFLGACHRKMS